MSNEQLNPEAYDAPEDGMVTTLPIGQRPVTPDDPPWSSPMALVVWLLSVAAIVVFPAIGLIGYILATGRTQLVGIETDQSAIMVNLLAIIPAHIATLALAWLIVTTRGTFGLRETLGLSSGGFPVWGYPLFIIGFFVVSAIVGSFVPEGDNAMMEMLRNSRTATYIVAFLATFTAPAVEEVVYRGVMYSAFQRSAGVPAAVGIVTLLFALVHVPQYWGSPATIIMLVLLSLSLTVIRARTGNLLPCIVMHTVFNAIQSVGLLTGFVKQ